MVAACDLSCHNSQSTSRRVIERQRALVCEGVQTISGFGFVQLDRVRARRSAHVEVKLDAKATRQIKPAAAAGVFQCGSVPGLPSPSAGTARARQYLDMHLSKLILACMNAQVELDAKAAELFTPAAVPAWFTAGVHLGSLCLVLEPPGAFSAEAYALDLGFGGVPDDCKLNLGEQLLRVRVWACCLSPSSCASPGHVSYDMRAGGRRQAAFIAHVIQQHHGGHVAACACR